MNPLIPYIDSQNLETNGSCYTLFDDYILVYHADDSVTSYKIINDKIYLSSSSSDFPSQDSGGDTPPCEPLICDNIANIPNTGGNYNGISLSVSDNIINTSGTYAPSGSTLFSLNRSATSVEAGTYNIILSHPIDYIFSPSYPYQNNSCRIPVGETSISCTFSSSWNNASVVYATNSSPLTISDLEVYIGPSETFCSYGSETTCPDVPIVDDSSIVYCMSYDDIVHIPHSMAGLSPFYCFLCVVIFLILLYIPYKIFIRPFFKSKL